VKEEVVINKAATDRVETIRDTVRREDVDVTGKMHALPAARRRLSATKDHNADGDLLPSTRRAQFPHRPPHLV
jgi:hypothetical protein